MAFASILPRDFSNNIKDAVTDPWGSKYDAQRIFNLERMAHQIWTRKPGATVIFEHLSDNPEQAELASYGNGILLWGNLNYNATEGAMGYVENSDLSSASYLDVSRGWSKPSLLGYMESHDEERLLYKCINFGNSAGSFDIKTLPVALNRAALTAALFIPIPGPKMIWQFEELGYDVSINYLNDRTGVKPLHWDYLDNTDRAKLNKVFSQLFSLKKKYPIFSTADFTNSLNGGVKWIKLNLNDEHVLIVGNFGLFSANPALEFQKTGTWYDLLGQQTINVTSTPQTVTLASGEFKIYSTQNLGNMVTAVPIVKQQEDFEMSPNPATDYLKVISSTGSKHISIYTLTGAKAKEFQLSGIPGVENNLFIGDLHSGIYLLKTQDIQGQTIVRKVIKRP